jgi:hypothetical protein
MTEEVIEVVEWDSTGGGFATEHLADVADGEEEPFTTIAAGYSTALKEFIVPLTHSAIEWLESVVQALQWRVLN